MEPPPFSTTEKKRSDAGGGGFPALQIAVCVRICKTSKRFRGHIYPMSIKHSSVQKAWYGSRVNRLTLACKRHKGQSPSAAAAHANATHATCISFKFTVLFGRGRSGGSLKALENVDLDHIFANSAPPPRQPQITADIRSFFVRRHRRPLAPMTSSFVEIESALLRFFFCARPSFRKSALSLRSAGKRITDLHSGAKTINPSANLRNNACGWPLPLSTMRFAVSFAGRGLRQICSQY